MPDLKRWATPFPMFLWFISKSMPLPAARHSLWALAILGLLVLAAILLLPLVASTQLVRSRIAQELSERSGYRVTLGEAPDLVVWPRFRAELRKVALHDWARADDRPVLTADRVEADLSAWQALFGGIEMSRVTLHRPVLELAFDKGVPAIPLSTGEGRLESAIEQAREGKAGSQPALGVISFIDGRIVDAASGADIATGVSGIAEWPVTDAPASLNLGAVWHGEPISLSAFAGAPMKLAVGEATDVRLSVKSGPVNAEFDGSLVNSDQPTVDGKVSLNTPSLRDALRWTGLAIGPASNVEAISLSGTAQGDLGHLKLSDAALQFEEYPGDGALELSFSEGRPVIAGTLAFERIDFGAFLEAFSGPATAEGRPVVNLDFTRQFGLDLRLSASEASGAGVTLGDVAATAQVRPGFAAFDISDASGFGGSVQAGYRAERKADGDVSELRLSGTDIDWGSIAALAGWTSQGPRGKGSLSATLSGPVTDWPSFPRRMSGMIGGRMGAGSIDGIDLAKLFEQPAAGGFAPLASIAGGATKVDGAEFKATLANGIARLDAARAQTQDETIGLQGVISYLDRSLALSGAVKSRDAASAEGAVRRFFIGGSWAAPFVTPTIPDPIPE